MVSLKITFNSLCLWSFPAVPPVQHLTPTYDQNTSCVWAADLHGRRFDFVYVTAQIMVLNHQYRDVYRLYVQPNINLPLTYSWSGVMQDSGSSGILNWFEKTLFSPSTCSVHANDFSSAAAEATSASYQSQDTLIWQSHSQFVTPASF